MAAEEMLDGVYRRTENGNKLIYEIQPHDRVQFSLGEHSSVEIIRDPETDFIEVRATGLIGGTLSIKPNVSNSIFIQVDPPNSTRKPE